MPLSLSLEAHQPPNKAPNKANLWPVQLVSHLISSHLVSLSLASYVQHTISQNKDGHSSTTSISSTRNICSLGAHLPICSITPPDSRQLSIGPVSIDRRPLLRVGGISLACSSKRSASPKLQSCRPSRLSLRSSSWKAARLLGPSETRAKGSFSLRDWRFIIIVLLGGRATTSIMHLIMVLKC